MKDSERNRLQEQESQEWLDALDDVLERGGPSRVRQLLHELESRAGELGITAPYKANTPYVNTISHHEQPPFPGSREIERRIKSIIRWNAMAMVVHANRRDGAIGGHISTYASAATLYEVAFNHFLRARDGEFLGDHLFVQGHASPGIYARAYMEGRLTAEQLRNFRRELQDEPGLPSYPHARLQPDFWEYATVSMGLSPIMGIYQARFNRYLEDRELVQKGQTGKVWVFLGDGETDEPEALGAISLAARERLDNLIFVVNCNLQRLDGPVRGNGKIIQELEAIFRGAGWNVLKVIWGEDWDPLLDADEEGRLVRAMEAAVDGDYQKFVVEDGSYIRKRFFEADPEVGKLVRHLSDEQLQKLRRGGHDPIKVFAAYDAAVRHKGSPCVVLAKTIKGYGLGEAGEGKNITHKQKKLNEQELREFRSRFGIPIGDEEVGKVPFYRPPEDSPEMRYLLERRQKLGGFMPARHTLMEPIGDFDRGAFAEFHEGSGERDATTTMVAVRLLSKLLRDESIGRLIVPIVPDEARTFGMESLFRQVGIYSHVGQNYEPVDASTLLFYNEATQGQILEEGITEAGSMSSFIAAGTAGSSLNINTIPFFFFYSMFGFQRIGDLIWAAGDMQARGFLIGATAGRTTLAGEGLQHQDGHSHLLALPHPHVRAWDPAYAYEVAVIIEQGIEEMYREQNTVIYYLTVTNEAYPMPPMPEGAREGILRGMYRIREAAGGDDRPRVALLGSGSILKEALAAQTMLQEEHDVAAEVWSVTSYKELYTDCIDVERANRLHPDQEAKVPYITQTLGDSLDAVVAASDYVRALPATIGQWVPAPLTTLGTDGFGRSESRPELRDFFEVDARHIVLGTLSNLARQGRIQPEQAKRAREALEINPEKRNPRTA